MSKSIIKYRISEIIETASYNIDFPIQKEAKMQVIYCGDKDSPDFVYGQLSSGSTQSLKTVNPEVYNAWYVGAIVVQEMDVQPAPVQ